MDPWVQVIASVGFPAAIAVFMLVRLDATLREMLKTLTELRLLMESWRPRPPDRRSATDYHGPC